MSMYKNKNMSMSMYKSMYKNKNMYLYKNMYM